MGERFQRRCVILVELSEALKAQEKATAAYKEKVITLITVH